MICKKVAHPFPNEVITFHMIRTLNNHNPPVLVIETLQSNIVLSIYFQRVHLSLNLWVCVRARAEIEINNKHKPTNLTRFRAIPVSSGCSR